MTTELEQEFFKVFGIEPISKWHKCKDYSCVCCDEYDNCAKREFIYPEITDRILLEMICIKSKDNNGYRISASNHKLLREEILKDLMKTYSTYVMCTWEEERGEKLKHQIQQLFKEGK